MNNVQVHYDVPEEQSGISFLPYLPSIIMQRKWLVLLPALFGLIIGLAVAFLLPVKYQSRAVLLVEAPLLPEEVALDPSGAEVVDQRMARIRQQVLSRPQLIELIQRNNLYQTELRTSSLSEVIDEMRNSITIEPVTADIQATGSGRKSTIAFAMSFFYNDPVKVQAVAQALTEQVLQIDATKNAAQAGNTVEFLTDQATDLQTQISQLENTISQIKAQYGLSLAPGIGMVGGNSTNALDAQIAALTSANAQLAAQKDLNNSAAERDPAVLAAEQNLSNLQARYTDNHPDIVLAKQALAEAKELAQTNAGKIPTSQIDAQIASNRQQLAALEAARNVEAGRSQAMLEAQARAPAVQQQVSQLQQRLDGLNVQYQRVSGQLLSARAGQRAEEERQGERLSLVDAPVIPDEPVSPNRPLIVGLLTAAGLGLGLGLILLIELVMKPIRDTNAVVAATGEAPLVVIPTILARGERKRAGFRSLWPFGGGGDDDDDDEDDDDDSGKAKRSLTRA